MFGFGFVAGNKVKLNDGREGVVERNFIGTCFFQIRLADGNHEVVHRDQMKKIK